MRMQWRQWIAKKKIANATESELVIIVNLSGCGELLLN